MMRGCDRPARRGYWRCRSDGRRVPREEMALCSGSEKHVLVCHCVVWSSEGRTWQSAQRSSTGCWRCAPHEPSFTFTLSLTTAQRHPHHSWPVF